MTMPSLIAKFQMKSFETAFKKQYSVIQNTIDYLVLENSITECYMGMDHNEITSWYVSRYTDCTALKQGLISKLNLSEIKNDFYKNYAKKADVLANGGHTINNGVSYDDFTQIMNAYLLSDGAVILMTAPERATNNNYIHVSMIVDVNGKKGPNKWGYDVFYMTLVTHKASQKILLTDQYSSIVEKGGLLPRTILRGAKENSDYNWNWN